MWRAISKNAWVGTRPSKCTGTADMLKDCNTGSELHWMKESDYEEDADGEDEIMDVQDLCRLAETGG
jgi:hypothetical protein